eukprot:4199306-Pleurochrysis_carterae.AAC.1
MGVVEFGGAIHLQRCRGAVADATEAVFATGSKERMGGAGRGRSRSDQGQELRTLVPLLELACRSREAISIQFCVLFPQCLAPWNFSKVPARMISKNVFVQNVDQAVPSLLLNARCEGERENLSKTELDLLRAQRSSQLVSLIASHLNRLSLAKPKAALKSADTSSGPGPAPNETFVGHYGEVLQCLLTTN